jgi:hypothetical protein
MSAVAQQIAQSDLPGPSIPSSAIVPGVNELADQIRCETCGKLLNRNKPLSSLLNHAKRHFTTKQFVCTECNYGSSEAAHVRNHMRMRHHLQNQEPLDTK